ncbi:penicillin-binding transpeptidase domain-containing protein [Helcococcus ovis]|uniref:penicillin-binding transpeptidase domain-containing protein n=1 Tax=Helcococcus ovis TaxID=72026 RepID=UPI0038BA90ED
MKKKANEKMLKNFENTDAKMYYFLIVLAFFVFIYIIRFYMLQIVDINDYKIKGQNIVKVGSVINSARGSILDRNGKELAITQKIDSLYMLPVTTKEKSEKAEKIISDSKKFNSLSSDKQKEIKKQASISIYRPEEIEKISNILGISKKIIDYNIKNSKEGYIYDGLNKIQKEKIEELNLNYLKIVQLDKRLYPNNNILSSTLGFTENNVGEYGLEKYYDKVLSGELGYKEFYKALHGTEIPFYSGSTLEAKESRNIVTTINLDLQKILYKYTKEAMISTKSLSATAVLMNPNNGEVLAMESFPSFNPNSPRMLNSDIDKLFLSNLDKSKESEYLISRWNNNAVSMRYDPGSVYKVITTSIALEADNEIKNKIYDDNGYYEIAPGVIIRSWRYWDPHGQQNLREALKNSSNPVFVQVAKDIGKQRYIDYGQSFRFGHKTGIDLPNEIDGFFPNSPAISDVDFGIMSYGHYVNVNPTQLLSSINTTVNGGKYYKPHLLKKIQNKNNQDIYENKEEYLGKTISETTSKEVREYLEYTADSYGLNTEKVKFGAKTGTTVKYTNDNIFNHDNEKYESVYASIFMAYPSDKPKYTLLLVLNEPLTSQLSSDTAVPFANKIMKDVVSYDSGDSNKLKKVNSFVKIPNVIGLSFEEASVLLDKNNVKATTNQEMGRFHIIKEQNPSADGLLKKDDYLRLDFDSKIKVPDLIGRNVRNIGEYLKLNKINYIINGKGNTIKSQSVKPGEIIDDQQIIKLETE